MIKPKKIKEVVVAENDFVTVHMDILKFPDGSERSHVKVSPKNKGGVVLVVLNENQEVYLHSAYHYAADITQLEFIRGFFDPNESDIESAKRELFEEIEFNCSLVGNPRFLGRLYSDSTILSGEVKIFQVNVQLQGGLNKQRDNLEALGNGSFFTFSQLEKMIFEGEITDGFTLAAFSLIKAKNIANK